MFGENEKQFVDSVVNHLYYVAKVQDYLKENYNVSSEYDEETETLYLKANNINESLNLAAAKEYVNETIDPVFLTVEI